MTWEEFVAWLTEKIDQFFAFYGEWKLVIILGTLCLIICIFFNQLVNFLNTFIDLCGKLRRIRKKIFRIIGRFCKWIYAGIKKVVLFPVEIYRIYRLRDSPFYVEPRPNETTYDV